MALFAAFKNKSVLKSAIQQTVKAREEEGAKADLLFKSAYEGFASVVSGDLVMGEALYNWGFSLLHQAKTLPEEDSVKLYLEAISKFTFCLIVSPNHLGAAIDGGVAYMDLARLMEAEPNDELYELALEFFVNAERIQRGSSAFNLACIFGIQEREDACLEALELSMECGSLPSVDDIVNDADLAKVKNTKWFAVFMEQVTAEPVPEVVDTSVEKFDEIGNVVIKKKVKKGYENEVDGIVYDAEGNVLNDEEEQQPVVKAAKKKAPIKKVVESTKSVEEKTE